MLQLQFSFFKEKEKRMTVNLKFSLIRRHLAEGPSFEEQTAGAGGTPRQSYLSSI